MSTALHTGTLTLGAVTLGVTDDDGVAWILEGVTGWSDAPPTTGTVEQRSSDHGGWPGAAYYDSRVVEVTGTILAADWATCGAAIDQLMAAIPLSEPDWLYIDEGYRELQALVRQAGDPLVERRGGWARFSLSLVAPDPRRYGNQLSSATGLPQTSGGLSLPITLPLTIGATATSGLLTLVNDGNMSTRPVFAITGPCPPFTITHVGTGKRLSSTEAVDAGRTLYLDVDQRMGLLDGTALRVITGTWFELEPGTNEVQFSSPSYNAAALLTAIYRPAWR